MSDILDYGYQFRKEDNYSNNINKSRIKKNKMKRREMLNGRVERAPSSSDNVSLIGIHFLAIVRFLGQFSC